MKATLRWGVIVTSGFLFTQSGAVDEPRAAVIVQGHDMKSVARAVRAAGGIVTHELDIIDAVGAQVSASQQRRLERTGLRFYEDARVETVNTATTATRYVLDKFDTVSYANNNGTQSWANNWVEVNDDGAPWRSDHISITSDAGYNRLRIASSGKGIWRMATLPSTATKATLTFTYRRANLDYGDNVAVQASKDGGVTWTTLGRISGAANDTYYRSATYDLTAYRSSKTCVRFWSAFSSSNEATWTWPNDAVFVDDVKIVYDGFIPGTSYPALPGVESLHAAGIKGTGLAVAVIDSGLWTHPSLINGAGGWMRVTAQYDAIRNVMVANWGATPVTDDGSGHGTHVSSLIFNSAKKASKYMGVAPDAQMVSIKAFDSNGAGRYTDVIRALNWVLANGAAYDVRVLNCSFSAPARSRYWQDPLNQAVMKIWRSGITVVASAGNRGPGAMTIGVPGNIPYIITVGAMSDNVSTTNAGDDFLASFSSVGPTQEGFVKPEIVAPGGHAWGLMSMQAEIAQKHPQFFNDGDYFSMSGTSQSTAVVSGVVALMQSRGWLDPDDAKCRLLAAARAARDSYGKPAYSVFQQGAGVVNAEAAVYGTGYGCANGGMDVSADLAGTRHYAGPANRDPLTGLFYLRQKSGTGYSWNGTYSKGSGYLWDDVFMWDDHIVWDNVYTWDDVFAWDDVFLWEDTFVWDDTSTASASIGINIWANQE